MDIKIDKSSKRKAFTLIELLIVVAIIGILASILAPSLQRARKAGHRAVCVSNERQIGLLFEAYKSDSDEYYPTYSTSAEKVSWDDMLGDYDGRELSQTDKELWNLNNDENISAVYRCPGSIQQRSPAALMSYGINSTRVHDTSNINAIRGIAGFLGPGAGGNGWSVAAGEVANPSDALALLESQMFSNIFGHTTAEGYISLGHFTYRMSPFDESRLHNDQKGGAAGIYIHETGKYKMNFLFIDGHVEFNSVKRVLGDAYTNFLGGIHNSSAATGTSWNILD